MKALKLILIVFGMAIVLNLNAQSFAEQPTARMQSTSTMMTSGSELPQAAITGTYTTYTSNASAGTLTGPDRAVGDDDEGEVTPPADPNDPGTPLGDTPWVLMLLLAVGYGACVWRKKDAAERV